MKKSKVLLNISAIVCFIYGAVYIFSLVFIPIGVYCFSAGKQFSYNAEHLEDSYSTDQKMLKAYTVFVSIACLPFGLFAVLAYLSLFGNNVRVVKSKPILKEETEQQEDNQASIEAPESEEEKLIKLQKLENFKEKGIITEAEFEMAKEQMFGKK